MDVSALCARFPHFPYNHIRRCRVTLTPTVTAMNPGTLALLLLLTPLSRAQETDDFEGGDNDGGWSFNVAVPDILETTGGNPGGFLHNTSVSSFAPIPTTDDGTASGFLGDLRALGITALSVDAITNSASFGAGGREFSLLLRDTKGTLAVTDDDYAYYVGSEVPQPGAGWKSFQFPVPSLSTDPVPPGWSGGWAGDLENFRPGIDWNDVITSVDRVELWWLNPSFFAIFQDWDVGIDNVSLVSTPAPVPALHLVPLVVLALVVSTTGALLRRRT